MICNAVHPQAEALAAAGVVIEPCQLSEHPEGRHVFLTSAPVRPVRIHVVLNLTPEQWANDARVQTGFTAYREALSERARLRHIASTVSTTQEHLGIPVGVVVRTYTEGGSDDAA